MVVAHIRMQSSFNGVEQIVIDLSYNAAGCQGSQVNSETRDDFFPWTVVQAVQGRLMNSEASA